MTEKQIPEGMISVEEFAKLKEITQSKVIDMVREGFYVGRKVGEEWFVDASESTNSARTPSNKKGTVKNFPMKNIIFFDSMLTPKIITFVYWLMLLGFLISGLSTMISDYGGGIIAGLLIIIGGAIGSRIWCELLIVLFKIHENLQKMASKSE